MQTVANLCLVTTSRPSGRLSNQVRPKLPEHEGLNGDSISGSVDGDQQQKNSTTTVKADDRWTLVKSRCSNSKTACTAGPASNSPKLGGSAADARNDEPVAEDGKRWKTNGVAGESGESAHPCKGSDALPPVAARRKKIGGPTAARSRAKEVTEQASTEPRQTKSKGNNFAPQSSPKLLASFTFRPPVIAGRRRPGRNPWRSVEVFATSMPTSSISSNPPTTQMTGSL